MAVGCVSVAQAHTSLVDSYGETNTSDRLQGTPSGYGPGALHGADIVWVTAGWTASVGCASFDSKSGDLTAGNSVPTVDKTSAMWCESAAGKEDADSHIVMAPSTPNGAGTGWNRLIFCLKDVTNFATGTMTTSPSPCVAGTPCVATCT